MTLRILFKHFFFCSQAVITNILSTPKLITESYKLNRLNALNAFELGQDLSQRNGYLPQVITGPEILRGAGYYTAHSGITATVEI